MEENNIYSKISVFSFIFQYARKYKLYLGIGIIAIILSSVSILLAGQIIRSLIDEGIKNNNYTVITNSLFTMMGIMLVTNFSIFLRITCISYAGEKVISDIRKDVYAYLINLPPSFFEKTRIPEIQANLLTDTAIIQDFINHGLANFLRHLITLIGGVFMLVKTSQALSLQASAGIPLIFLLIAFLGKKVKKLSKLARNSISEIANQVDDTFYGIQTLQSFNYQPVAIKIFNDLVEKTFDTFIKYARMRAILIVIIMTAIFGMIILITWLGVNYVYAGKATAGELSAFILFSLITGNALNSLSDIYGKVQSAIRSIEKVISLFGFFNPAKTANEKFTFDNVEVNSLEFKNIGFTYYEEKEQTILTNFSLFIKKGEKIAIVGPSGAGKSTLFSLLLRFYSPMQGEILVNGIDITTINLHDLRNLVAWVPQEGSLFSGTILENILMGKPSADYNEVVEATKRAHAWEFIQSLPYQFQTNIGEKGTKLSSGQRQRLAIARAILKDAPILLFDEITSALDAESESFVQEYLRTIKGVKTTIIIAHRLSTVSDADKILVLKNGEIVEIGQHKELLSAGGLYSKMVSIQFTA